MNAEQLLQHFERISEAPDAIPRLRRFILDLAVRGKLVEQEPADEPAAELLKRIAAEKARMLKEAAGRNRRKENKDLAVTESEKYLTLPGSWSWIRLVELGYTQTGTSPSSANSDLFGDEIPFIKPGDLDGDEIIYDGPGLSLEGIKHSRLAASNTVLMVCIGATLGKVNTTKRPICFNQQINSVTPVKCVEPMYLELALKCPEFQKLAWSKAGTGTLPIISKGKWEVLPIPLPPLPEQHRIVAKVDELMKLCDQLEAAKAEREKCRDSLVAASLQRLNQPAEEEETFREHAHFTFNNLKRITTRAAHIKQLRQTILNLAVRGKLVEQDPSDEPASEMLKGITAEKMRLVKAGEIKKAEPVANLTASFDVFRIPTGWAISNLQSVCKSVTDGDHLPPPKAETGIPFLVIGNVRTQRIEFEGSRFVPNTYYDALDPIRRPRHGDLLYTLVGSYGIPILVRDDKPFCVQRHIGILRPSALMSVEFLARVMDSLFAYEQATACATGIAQKTVSLSGLRKLIIPLPPLAEQHRIVAKVDELMAICDQLGAQITETGQDSRRFLEAVLNEALHPLAQAA